MNIFEIDKKEFLEKEKRAEMLRYEQDEKEKQQGIYLISLFGDPLYTNGYVYEYEKKGYSIHICCQGNRFVGFYYRIPTKNEEKELEGTSAFCSNRIDFSFATDRMKKYFDFHTINSENSHEWSMFIKKFKS